MSHTLYTHACVTCMLFSLRFSFDAVKLVASRVARNSVCIGDDIYFEPRLFVAHARQFIAQAFAPRC